MAIGFCLSGILLLLPFAFSSITFRYSLVFLMVAIVISSFIIRKKEVHLLSESGKLLLGIVVFVVFNLSGEANIFQKFNIGLKFNIPLATCFLSLGFLFFLIKNGIKGRVLLPKSRDFHSIIHAMVLLLIAMIILFPALKAVYDYDIGSNFLLLRDIIQMLFALLIVHDFLSSVRNPKVYIIVFCGFLYLVSIFGIIT